GGGTIDMAGGRVVRGENGTEIRIENIGGVRDLGGTNIDQIVMDLIVEEFQRKLIAENKAEDHSSVQVPYLPVHFKSLPKHLPAETIEAMRGNVRFFEEAAEQAKMAINERAADFPVTVTNLKALVGDDTEVVELPGGIVNLGYEPFVQRVRSVMGRAEAAVRSMMSEMGPRGRRIDQEASEHIETGVSAGPDVLFMAGGSSRLNVVLDFLKEKFPGSEIVTSDKPKACVALGACLYGFQEARGIQVIKIVDEFDGRTTSAFGISSLDRRTFQPVFYCLVPKKSPLPAEAQIPSNLVAVRRGISFEVLQNFGWTDTLAANPDVEHLVVFRIADQALDGAPSHELNDADVFLSVRRDESVELRLQFPSGHRITFDSPGLEMYSEDE
ncbi:MAG: hypothetical protein V2B18_05730, partial [Pseudomonadota bacterium]